MTTITEAIARERGPMELVARHPLRVRIIGAIGAWRRSPKDVAAEIEAPLGVVAYHVRELRKAGLLARAGERRSRGAVETFYRVTPLGVQAVGDLCDAAAVAVATTAMVDEPRHRESRA